MDKWHIDSRLIAINVPSSMNTYVTIESKY